MKSLIIKFGTESLMRERMLHQETFGEVARQVAQLVAYGTGVTIVSSGGIQAGREYAASLGIATDSLHKKDLAGLGSMRLMEMWSKAFAEYSIGVAQVWITHANLHDEAEKRSITSSIANYHRAGIVAIVNENDVVSAREIKLMEQRISENDQLARMLADITKAKRVLFITSVGGVYETDPTGTGSSRMYQELNINALPVQVINGTGKSKNGNGGMGKKVLEAVRCCQNDCKVAIADISNDAIIRFAAGESVGTSLGLENKF